VYTDLQGNPITFEAYEGKVRVVNSWASWTPFSVAELTDLESLAQEFKSKDVVILAINRKEPKEIANQFLKTIQEFKEIVFIIDITDAYYASTRGFAMPETVIYDATGKIVFHKRGQMTKEEMQKYVTLAITQSN
jgi:thiol-disulfide isomerase/thioredoxin